MGEGKAPFNFRDTFLMKVNLVNYEFAPGTIAKACTTCKLQVCFFLFRCWPRSGYSYFLICCRIRVKACSMRLSSVRSLWLCSLLLVLVRIYILYCKFKHFWFGIQWWIQGISPSAPPFNFDFFRFANSSWEKVIQLAPSSLKLAPPHRLRNPGCAT